MIEHQLSEREKSNWIKSIMLGIAAGVMTISGVVLWLGGILIHLWTIIIAFSVSGFFAAFMTFMLPVLAQIYWLFESFRYSETYLNNYSLAILVYVILFVFVLLCGSIISAVEDK